MTRLIKPMVFLLLTLGLGACGSYETVDSKDVPLKQGPAPKPGTLPELMPVQDIHQSYLATYFAESKTTEVLAQFRVRDSFGDTIRMGKADQVQFAGAPLRLVDADVVGPIASLFHGTFYHAIVSGPAGGEFVFTDDRGNRVTLPVRAPKINLTAGPLVTASLGSESRRNGNSSDYTASFYSDDDLQTFVVDCYLQSTANDLTGQPQSVSSHVPGARSGKQNGTCTFSASELQRHLRASPLRLELKVELTARQRSRDAWSREQESVVRSVVRATIKRAPVPGEGRS